MVEDIKYHQIPNWAFEKLDTNDHAEEVQWWEAQNIPWQLVKELRRRNNTTNVGQNSSVDVVYNFEQQYLKYRGPMTPWVRAFSNGTGNVVNKSVPRSKYLYKNNSPVIYDGFLMQGGEGFGNAYGFSQNNGVLEQDKAILGYQANGAPHYIDTSFRTKYNYNTAETGKFPQNNVVPSVLPPPGIVSINIKTNKEMMSNAIIQWKCYSLAQLEYMAPFWLSPKINVFLEFGWNLYDIKSMIDLDDREKCYMYLRRPEIALQNYYQSFGNYGLITGIINKYNFNTDDGFVYTCNTEIISRQAMYAGYRIDNPTLTETDVDTIEYSTLKDFFANYLQFAKEIIKLDGADGNYINYIINHSNELAKKINDKKASDNKKVEAQGTVSNNLTSISANDGGKQNTKVFYDGKKENRIFMGRYQEVYGAAKLPQKLSAVKIAELNSTGALGGIFKPTVDIPKIEVINYGKTKNGYDVISYADKVTDFDYNESGNDEVWFQLDFIFEIINLFCSEKYSKNNRIDISDIIVSAHPNLISCDKNVLIPNPRAPKVNNGRPSKGYLEKAETDEETNEFIRQSAWEQISQTTETNQSLLKAAKKAKDSFKTNNLYRDDLDAIINWLFYKKGLPKPELESAAFPFKKDKTIKKRSYEAGYNGYLKHLYISKSKMIEISNDSSLTTLQQFVNKILNVINDAVDNFWNFEVVKNPMGGLSIIDKNLALPKKSPLYMFDIASTNNVVKKISFDVTLTNEQTNQVLYGSGQNEINVAQDISKTESSSASKKEKITKIAQIKTGIPSVAYTDRLDGLELQQQCDAAISRIEKTPDQGTPDETDTVPHGPLVDKHLGIRAMQTQGKQDSEILVMRVRIGHTEESVDDAVINDSAKFDWMYLNLPPSLKGKLREMLDDGDKVKNTAKYAGPADNFTISLTFDGIMGFRMFQHFAVANLPKPYVPGNVIFMINEVEHQLNAGKWETVVTAMLRCAPDQDYQFITI